MSWIKSILTELHEMNKRLQDIRETLNPKKNDVYVSERIVNLKELERMIDNSYLRSQRILQLFSEENPDYEKILGVAKALNGELSKASRYEIEIERRKTISH